MSDDSIARDQLRAFIERIERMEEEKAAVAADIKEIYAEAKGNGFDTKILRKIVAIRKQDSNERAEQEALLELYMASLGMIDAPEAADAFGSQIQGHQERKRQRADRSGYTGPVGFDTDGTA